MAEVVNLRRARKRKAREDAETEADRRREEFGVTKAARVLARAERELAERALTAHRLDRVETRKPDDGQ